jgi:spore coat protein CotF
MPYGAHETMEVHEILLEKINMITHFNLYAREAKNPQLLDMIVRHQQEEIRAYNEIVAYTHDYNRFTPVPPNTNIRGINPEQIQYGLNKPPQFVPQSDTVLSDWEVATAMLLCHKNAARNSTWATLECADPNLRQLLLNSAANCANQAYEVFLFMNQQGMYQVPTLRSHTAKTLLHSYQPAGPSLEAQYSGQNTGYAGQTMANLSAGSPESALYGGMQGQGYGRSTYASASGQAGMTSRSGSAGQNQTGSSSIYGGQNMPQ